MTEQNPNMQRINLEISGDEEQGSYANFLTVMHSDSEFILDFGFFVPNKQAIKILSRIIAHPKHAKNFMIALAENIRKYESHFGEIPSGPDEPHRPSGQGSDRVN